MSNKPEVRYEPELLSHNHITKLIVLIGKMYSGVVVKHNPLLYLFFSSSADMFAGV